MGQMLLSFYPPGGAAANGFTNWEQMGRWYANLTSGRRDPSNEIKQKVAELTASAPNQLDKMRAIARFMQQDIRYVAIELGVGGWQPHPAPEVFSHRYGDCTDKATLMSSMLSAVGVESYYVAINTERGSVTAQTPANPGGFDHVILAIKLPDSIDDPSLIAVMKHPKLGRLLFFDPTNELTPFGQIGGYLQANYGLLVTPDGGELVELPEQPLHEQHHADGEANARSHRQIGGDCGGNACRRPRLDAARGSAPGHKQHREDQADRKSALWFGPELPHYQGLNPEPDAE